MTSRELAAAYPIAERDLAKLHTRLAHSAATDGLLDVAYREIDSPIGPLLLATTPVGLVRVAFLNRGAEDDVLQSLADRISPRILHAPARLDAVAQQLDDYFAGRRLGFDVALDWQLAKGFRLTVLSHLAADVDYGHTASYARLAELAGNPKAVRAVGSACATNPIPVVVPCHRVIRSDGGLGEYGGGPEAKRILLTLEGAAGVHG